MGVEFQTKGKQQGDIYYVNSPVPCIVEESFDGYLHEHDDFPYAEVLQDQESVYQSLQRTAQNETVNASPHADTRSNNSLGQIREKGNTSVAETVESQVAIDEALARELQELENQLAGTSVGGDARIEAEITPKQSSSANGEGSSANTSTQVSRQDDIDPDNMTYEELLSFGEALGTECKGLSDELISYLPSSTYKTGLFSKKEKYEECIICREAYKNREKLIMLPCQHQYHKNCITRWLKMNKACPICNEEVFGS